LAFRTTASSPDLVGLDHAKLKPVRELKPATISYVLNLGDDSRPLRRGT
jgi:hypothetical protein